MTSKSLIRRVMDAITEGRTRQAQRFVDDYMKSHRSDRGRQG